VSIRSRFNARILAFFQMQRGSLLNDGSRSGRFSSFQNQKKARVNIEFERKENEKLKEKELAALYGDLFVCFTYIFICKRFLFGEPAQSCVYGTCSAVSGRIFSFLFFPFFIVYRRHLTEEKMAWAVLMPHLIFIFIFLKKPPPRPPCD
jgi:hypothetical protein